MNFSNKPEQIKKYIYTNNFAIVIQIILFILSIVFNFILDDGAVFMTVFIHTGIFVLYNIVVENIIEYGFLRKKYAKICDNTHHLRPIKLKKKIYANAKNKGDYVSTKLILQSFFKVLIVCINIILLLFMVNFE